MGRIKPGSEPPHADPEWHAPLLQGRSVCHLGCRSAGAAAAASWPEAGAPQQSSPPWPRFHAPTRSSQWQPRQGDRKTGASEKWTRAAALPHQPPPMKKSGRARLDPPPCAAGRAAQIHCPAGPLRELRRCSGRGRCGGVGGPPAYTEKRSKPRRCFPCRGGTSTLCAPPLRRPFQSRSTSTLSPALLGCESRSRACYVDHYWPITRRPQMASTWHLPK